MAKKLTINKIEPMTLARICGLTYAIIGLIGGIVVALLTVTGVTVDPSKFEMGIFGVASIVAFPVLYGLMGFIFGYLGAFVYNAVAKKIGGVKVEVQ